MKSLTECIEAGWKIEFWKQPKRMDVDYNLNGRDWVARYCWQGEYKDNYHTCVWEGFGTAQEAIDDFVLYVNKEIVS